MNRRLLSRFFNLSRSHSEPINTWGDPERDGKINAATEPPPGERIRFVSVTLEEEYPPSHIPALEVGLQRLGMAKDDSLTGDRETPLFSVLARRGNYAGRGWANIGVVVSSKKRFSYLPTKLVDAQLPASIDHVDLSLNYSPSIISVTATFVLADDAASLLHAELLKKYETTAIKTSKTRTRIHDAENKKRTGVQVVDSRLIDACSSWIRKEIPGLFSTFATSTAFPLIKFIVLETTEPLPGRPYSDAPLFLDLLGIGRAFSVWTSNDLSGLKLAQISQESGYHHFVLTGRRDTILGEEDLQSYGGRDDHSLVNRLRYDLQQLSRVLGYHALLSAFGRTVSLHRDQLASIKLNKRGATFKLQAIQKNIAESTNDIKSVVHDLARELEDDPTLLYDTPKFFLSLEGKDDDKGLVENVRLNSLYLCARIERAASDLMTNTTTTASILNLEKQDQMQSKVLLFTIATFLATATAVVIAVLAFLQSGE